MSERITIRTPEGSFGAYLARPGHAPAPAVVVLHDIYGLDAATRSTCDELAAQGFLALGPDLYWRMEPGAELDEHDPAQLGRALDLQAAFDVERCVNDVTEVIAQARALDGCTGRVGTLGFGLGGLASFLAAACSDADAAVACWGAGIEQYLCGLRSLRSALLLHLAQDDEFVTPDLQRSITAALQGHPRAEVHVHPGCGHGFARPGGRRHDAVAAARAQARTLDFLRLQLG